ncbi:hypothetical protein [Pseudomonas sp. CLCA07]
MADSVWEVLSTVSTTAAVAVALWFSVQATRANRKAEKDRLELAAAKMLSPLSALERIASYLSVCISFREVGTVEPDPIILKCLDDLEELAKAISIEDLYPLLKLPKHAAKRASRSLGLIQTFLADARSIVIHESWNGLESQQKAIYYNKWHGMISEIQDHLRVAVDACEIAASTGAPRPSPEEMYGEPSND